MSNLTEDVSELRKKYREIFVKSNEAILERAEKIKPKNACENCKIDCNCTKKDLLESFPQDCDLQKWQRDSIKLLDEDVVKQIHQRWLDMLNYRSQFKCINCATCCKLACSEFSYEELKEKSKVGDNFATQFISVFIPYESKEEAQKIYPEYFELLAKNLPSEDVYFYHCPKLTEDNLCSDYENRPQICRDFPDNPLSLLPQACGYSDWKEEIEPTALMLHSMLEIIEFYKTKLSGK